MNEEFLDLNRRVFLLCFKKLYPYLRELGLYPGQEEFLLEIAHKEGITPIDLAHETGRERSTITRSIQSLEKAGYILKVQDEFDKRKYHLYLTEKGHSISKEAQKKAQKLICQLKNTIDSKEEALLINILKKIEIELERN